MQKFPKNLLSDNENFRTEYTARRGTEGAMQCGHCHLHFEVYIQIAGKRQCFLKNNVYELREGDVVFIAPGLIHKTTNFGEGAYERLLIAFNDVFLYELTSFLALPRALAAAESLIFDGFRLFRNGSACQRWITLAREIVQLSQKEVNCSVAKQRILAGQLICDLLTDPYDPPEPNNKKYKIIEILNYINAHFRQDISLKELSEQFYLSYYYLSRLFKDVTGFTYVAYVNILRVNYARELVCQTEKNIEYIAEQAGFGSVKQFGRVFKELYGLSPFQYRLNIKKKGSLPEGSTKNYHA